MLQENQEKKSFEDLINESVHTQDDVDIGDIEALNRHFLVIKRGFVKIHYYYIPFSKVEGYDSKVLWLKITEVEVKKKYERTQPPDPLKYRMRDHFDIHFSSIVSASPVLPIIPSRSTLQDDSDYDSTTAREVSSIIECDLCHQRVANEDQLGDHILQNHN